MSRKAHEQAVENQEVTDPAQNRHVDRDPAGGVLQIGAGIRQGNTRERWDHDAPAVMHVDEE
jgi:hypothetical protein